VSEGAREGHALSRSTLHGQIGDLLAVDAEHRVPHDLNRADLCPDPERRLAEIVGNFEPRAPRSPSMAKDYGDLGTYLVEVEGLEPLAGEGRCRQVRLSDSRRSRGSR
jgi:hypothetical protein